MEIFAGAAMALYAAHHVGDYWVQTDHQARHKGDAGAEGRLQCLAHVLTYLMTQTACLLALSLVTATRLGTWQILVALAISGVTHYAADRREHGLMFWLARRIPGKATFLELGRPRTGVEIPAYPEDGPPSFVGDPPQLATGAWALDQAWHIFWGVFVAALVLSL
jgi:hypothetical protein